jgi:hypothetical protein
MVKKYEWKNITWNLNVKSCKKYYMKPKCANLNVKLEWKLDINGKAIQSRTSHKVDKTLGRSGIAL